MVADLGLYIPSSEELAVVKKVTACVEMISEMYTEKVEGVSLLDVLKENEALKAQVSCSSATVERLVAAREKLDSEPFREAARVAALMEETQRSESKARSGVETLLQEEADLQASLRAAEEKVEKAREADFAQASSLTLVSVPDASDPLYSEVLRLGHDARDGKVIRVNADGGEGVVFDQLALVDEESSDEEE